MKRHTHHVLSPVGVLIVMGTDILVSTAWWFSTCCESWHNIPVRGMFKVLLQWKSTSVYTSWTYSTYYLELVLGTFMRHFASACLVCHASWESISRFVFYNSQFQIAEAFQRLWYRLCLFEINRKRATGNFVMFTYTVTEVFVPHVVMIHNHSFRSIPFSLSLNTKWHDRLRYLSMHHGSYLMSLNSTRHSSKTLHNDTKWNISWTMSSWVN